MPIGKAGATRQPPPRPMGGVGRTKGKKRTPKEPIHAAAHRDYARLLAHGWDTWVETFDQVRISDELAAELDARQAEAAELGIRGDALAPMELGGELLQMQSSGGRSARWMLRNDDLAIDIRSPRMSWPISVRYSSAGLWEYGLAKQRQRVRAFMRLAFNYDPPADYTEDTARPALSCVVSSAHYAFDFYSPGFSNEMERPSSLPDQIVCHSSVKTFPIGTSARWETLTIGINRASLQVQVYDKATEIKENSGKTWMLDVYKAEGFEFGEDELGDIWRVEVRMGPEYLKERNARTPAAVLRFAAELIGEALHTHRLCELDPHDSNKRRWSLHPLWSQAVKATGAKSRRPRGQMITDRRSQLMRQAETQIAGAARAYSVLARKEFNPDQLQEFLLQVVGIIEDDPQHLKKVKRAIERYRFVDEAG